jgi:hypothetical protein
MKLLIHREGSPTPEIAEPGEKETVAELVGADGGGEIEVFLDEAEDALDLEAVATAIGAANGSQLMVSKKKKIKVEATVEYNMVPKVEDFKPQRRVRKVFTWAEGKKGFNLAKDQRPEHELALPGHEEPVNLDTPVGSLAGTDHKVKFELRRKGAYQG